MKKTFNNVFQKLMNVKKLFSFLKNKKSISFFFTEKERIPWRTFQNFYLLYLLKKTKSTFFIIFFSALFFPQEKIWTAQFFQQKKAQETKKECASSCPLKWCECIHIFLFQNYLFKIPKNSIFEKGWNKINLFQKF